MQHMRRPAKNCMVNLGELNSLLAELEAIGT